MELNGTRNRKTKYGQKETRGKTRSRGAKQTPRQGHGRDNEKYGLHIYLVFYHT